MSEIVEVGRYVSVDEQGNWSAFQGCDMLAYGRAGLTMWDEWATKNDWVPQFRLDWDSRADLYTLIHIDTDEKCSTGRRVFIYRRPGGTIGMELE